MGTDTIQRNYNYNLHKINNCIKAHFIDCHTYITKTNCKRRSILAIALITFKKKKEE